MTKEEMKDYNKEYYLKNNGRQRMVDYRKKHPIECLESVKQYRRTHKKEISVTTKKYYETHKEELKAYAKKYYYINKEKINNKFNLYSIQRRKTNVSFKILCNLRIRIWKALKGINKSKGTMRVIGCNIDFLKSYLESKFTSGMSWNNYSKWHIDHIKPCASFDLSKPSEQRKCFHYTNLQPLWAKDNLTKNKY